MSVSVGVVVDGHVHVKDATVDCAPACPSALSGVTAQ
jgi:hypothetical protein